jgi:ABC-type lipoprotein export system ATPase subunit
MTLLEELHGDGRTILLVTHDDAVAAYASRELRLQDGKILSTQPVSSAPLPPAIGGRP